MKALFPGSFDPFTSGHLDIALRALAMFGECVVGVAEDTEKRRSPLNIRLDLTKKSLDKINISVEKYSGLTTDFAKKIGAGIIIRGIRNQKDFLYEKNLFNIYKKTPGIEILYFMANSSISSETVRKRVIEGKSVEGLVPDPILSDILGLYKAK